MNYITQEFKTLELENLKKNILLKIKEMFINKKKKYFFYEKTDFELRIKTVESEEYYSIFNFNNIKNFVQEFNGKMYKNKEGNFVYGSYKFDIDLYCKNFCKNFINKNNNLSQVEKDQYVDYLLQSVIEPLLDDIYQLKMIEIFEVADIHEKQKHLLWNDLNELIKKIKQKMNNDITLTFQTSKHRVTLSVKNIHEIDQHMNIFKATYDPKENILLIMEYKLYDAENQEFINNYGWYICIRNL